MAFQSIQLFLKFKNVIGHWELTICDGETVGWSIGPHLLVVTLSPCV